MDDEEAANRIFDLTEGVFRSHCLFVVCDLEIPDIILSSPEPASIDYIAEHVKHDVDVGVLQRVLRYISAQGVFEEVTGLDGELLFKATKVTEYLSLSNPISGSFRVMHHSHPTIGHAIMNIHRLVKKEITGNYLFKEANNMSLWEYYATHERDMGMFQECLRVLSIGDSAIIHEVAGQISDMKSVVDVGGGSGANMQLLLKELPGIECYSLDLPEIIEKFGDVDGVKMIAGDMFQSETIPRCDAIYMKYILHDWNDENCIKILRSCYDALPSGGRLLCVDPAVPDHGKVDKSTKGNFFIDLMVMVCFGTRERTEAEVKDLLKKGGFEFCKIIVIPAGLTTHWQHKLFVARKV